MKIISYKDIEKLNICSTQYYDWVVKMIEEKKESILPPKISIKPRNGVFCNVMPSFIPYGTVQKSGVKVVTRYPEKEPSLDSQILLMDADNGEFLALLDGNWITAIRTGAVAAHSIMLLAKKKYKTIGIMGLGNVARATVLILLELNPGRQFHFKLLKYKGQELDFVKRFEKYSNFTYSFVDSAYEVVKGSDVVISGVTYAPVDFCPDDAYDEGILVVPIHTLGFTNCDLFFDKVYADDHGHICHFKNFDKFKYFAEVTDVLNGSAVGRENDNERILAYNIGLSIHDINFAAHIYELVKDSKDLLDIDLEGPKQKFWI